MVLLLGCVGGEELDAWLVVLGGSLEVEGGKAEKCCNKTQKFCIFSLVFFNHWATLSDFRRTILHI